MMKRVLLIDDDPLFIQRLKDALGDSVNLQVVSIAEEAIGTCARWQPDLVLLDVLIAPGDSFSILDDISRAERTGQFSVLCLSRGAGSTTRLQNFGNAVFGILERESDREALARTIFLALDRRKDVAA
jgi:DNA-binding NarL/FixJ family response regulator